MTSPLSGSSSVGDEINKFLKNRIWNISLRRKCPVASSRLSKILAMCMAGAPPRRWKWGGGGAGTRRQRSQDFLQGNRYQKSKTQRIWPTIFLKMGDYPPHSKNGGDASPRPPSYGAPGAWASNAGGGGGGGNAFPPVKNLGGDIAQIWKWNPMPFLFFRVFWGRLATCRRSSPNSKIRGDVPGYVPGLTILNSVRKQALINIVCAIS